VTSSDYQRHGTTILNVAIGRVADACTQRPSSGAPGLLKSGPPRLSPLAIVGSSQQLRHPEQLRGACLPDLPPRVQLPLPDLGFWLDLVEAFLSSTARQLLRCGDSHRSNLITAIQRFIDAWTDHRSPAI
jgi:hypothetical protein